MTLVERHDLNTQASGRNAGGLHGQIQLEPFLLKGEQWAREFGPSLPLMRAAIRFWRELEQELGVDLEVNVSGGLIVAGRRRAAPRPRAQGRDREPVRRRGRAARPGRPRARRAVRRRRNGRRAALPARGPRQPAPGRTGPRARRRRPRRADAAADGGARARTPERRLPHPDERRPARLRPGRRLRRCRGRGRGGARRRSVRGRALAADGLRDRAGATARRAPRLLRRRPADAQAGAPGHAPDRRRLAGAGRRPDRPPADRLRRARREPPLRDRGRARGRRQLAAPHLAGRLPGPRGRAPGDRRARARVRRGALSVHRLHLRAAARAGSPRASPSARRSSVDLSPFAPSRLL